MSRLSVLTKEADFSNFSSEGIYIQLMQLPCKTREKVQAIIDDWPLTKCFDRWGLYNLEYGD